MIYIGLVGDMGLAQVKAINSDLLALPGTKFTRRTYSWTTPDSNLDSVTRLAKSQPISYTVRK